MQIICNDKTIRSNTEQHIKDLNSKFLATQVEKGEHLLSFMPAIEKALFNGS